MTRRHGVTLRRQFPADSARMLAAFRAQPARRPLLLFGTDGPSLRRITLACARRCIGATSHFPADAGRGLPAGRPAPRGPDDLRRHFLEHASVMAQTRRRLAAAGLRWSEPATLWDVDTPDDLKRLASA